MDLKNLFKKEYIIGLDIGSSSVKIAQFAKREDGLHLLRAELSEIPTAEDDEAREKEILSALKHLFRGIDAKKSIIITTIDCPQTAIKKVTTPYMPKAELRQGISLEAKNYFHFPIDQATLDFEILGDIVEKGVRKYDCLVGVSPVNTVNRYLALLGKAGIKSSSFVSSSYSLHKLWEHLAAGRDETACLINIGESHTELIISKGKYLMFTRNIPIAGSDFTKAMTGLLVSDMGKTQLTMEEAEKIKRETGMPLQSDTRIIDNKIPAVQILAMLRSPAEQLVSEIDRCFDYYREESGGAKVGSVMLCGGGASLTGLIKFLSDALGMEVRLCDPLEGLKIEKDAVRERDRILHRLDMAVGAAMTEAKGINLLPAEIKDQTQRTIKRGTIEAIVTAVVIISVLFFVGMRIKINNFNKRISTAKLELSSLQTEIKKAEGIRLAEMVLKDEPYWEDIFKELGSLIPDEVIIENIKMSDNRLHIKGIISSADGQQILSGLIVTLENGLFSNAKLIESRNLPDRPGVEFEITCWIDYER